MRRLDSCSLGVAAPLHNVTFAPTVFADVRAFLSGQGGGAAVVSRGSHERISPRLKPCPDSSLTINADRVLRAAWELS